MAGPGDVLGEPRVAINHAETGGLFHQRRDPIQHQDQDAEVKAQKRRAKVLMVEADGETDGQEHESKEYSGGQHRDESQICHPPDVDAWQ